MPARRHSLMLLLALLVVASCGRRKEECRLLSEAIIEAAAPMKRPFGVAPDDLYGRRAKAEEASRTLTHLLGRLASLDLRVRELRNFSAQYQTFARWMRSQFDDLMPLLVQLARTRADAEALGDIMEQTDSFDACERTRKDEAACEELATILASASADADAETFAHTVDKLKAVVMRDPKVKEAAGELISIFDRGLAITRREEALSHRIEGIGKSIQQRVAAAQALDDGISQFCAR